MKSFILKFLKDEDASATVEFIIVLPVYTMIMWALTTLGGSALANIRATMAVRYAAWSVVRPAEEDINNLFFADISSPADEPSRIVRTEESRDYTAGDITTFLDEAAGTSLSYRNYIRGRNIYGFSSQIGQALSGGCNRVKADLTKGLSPWSGIAASGDDSYRLEVAASHTVTLPSGSSRTLLSPTGAGTFRTYMRDNLSGYQDMPKYQDSSRFWTDE